MGFVHRDIKPENILIDRTGTLPVQMRSRQISFNVDSAKVMLLPKLFRLNTVFVHFLNRTFFAVGHLKLADFGNAARLSTSGSITKVPVFYSLTAFT